MKKFNLRKIKIAIAEDQLLIRKLFISHLSHFNEFEIVYELSNGKELIDSLKNKTIEPDIILLNLQMPVMNGLEVLEIIRKRFDHLKVIMLGVKVEHSIIVDVITKGANAFLSKNGDPDDLIKAINSVFKDGHYFDKQTSQAMLQKLKFGASANPFREEIALSDREVAVMKEICDGLKNEDIAKRLFISPRTVNFHKANIFRKIKSKKVTDVVKYALRNGIIQLNPE